MRIAGLVLAAGAGTRMGGPKADLVVGDRTLLDRAVSALADGGCARVLAVVRSAGRPGVAEVVNPDPERGMRSSLSLGLDEVADADAVAVVLVDVPGLTAEAVAAVTGAWTPGRIAVGTARGRRTHPTVMSPQLWRDAVVLAEPDEGARRFIRAHPELVDEVEVDIDPTDLDTPEDLEGWGG